MLFNIMVHRWPHLSYFIDQKVQKSCKLLFNPIIQKITIVCCMKFNAHISHEKIKNMPLKVCNTRIENF